MIYIHFQDFQAESFESSNFLFAEIGPLVKRPLLDCDESLLSIISANPMEWILHLRHLLLAL